MCQGFIADANDNLTVDINDPFGFTDDTIVAGDEEFTKAYFISQLSSTQDYEII